MGKAISAHAPNIALFLPSLDGGGAERVFVQLANEFAALGLRVQLVLAAARGPYLDEVSAGVRLVDLDARGVLRSLPKLVRYLRSERPPVILSALDHSNVVAILACFLAGSRTRCVISMRSVPSAVYREETSARKWILPMAMRGSYRRAHRIIANSQVAASDLIENFRVQAEKVSVIYNPLDLESIERLSRERIENRWLSLNSAPLILGVGSLAVLKDFPTLIRAFSVVRSERECRLAILGEGPDRRDLEGLVAELGLQKDVYLPGFVNNPFAWMRAAEVVVGSSLTEGCPNALMQALACGAAVVSTDCVGGCSEILEGGRWGRLVPIKDAQAMAAAILATMNGTGVVDTRRRAGDFAIGGIARSYLRQLMPDFALPMAERES
jgi:glycosyltransferase involved in cell wall biosynthesis